MARDVFSDCEVMIGHKFRTISNGIDKFFDRHKPENEVKFPRGQMMMLGYLMEHRDETVYQKDLEAYFKISGATASTMLKSLEKNGMIQRIPSKQDARLKEIIPTEHAVAREERFRRVIYELEHGIADGFSEEELDQLFSLLNRIQQNLESMNEK